MFKATKVPLLVIGDVILDAYISGESVRLSPEAPVPIVLANTPDYRLGGAANVAANILSLGGSAALLGIRGNDAESKIVTRLLSAHGINDLRLDAKTLRTGKTIVKTRIIANNQQIVRLDSENTGALPEFEIDSLKQWLREVCAGMTFSGIVVSDYAKGLLTLSLLDCIRDCADRYSLPVFLDPKVGSSGATNFVRPVIVTPNLSEAEQITGIRILDSYDLDGAGRRLLEKFAASYALITRGDRGMTLFAADTVTNFPTTARAVFDVSGAGDTVIAALALAYISGNGITTAVDIANHAAGIVVGKRGTATCELDELNKALAS